MAQRVLSINIGDSVIKISEVSHAGGNTTVYNAMTFMTPAGSVEDGYIRNMGEVSKCIKSRIAQTGIKAKKVAFSLYSTKIATREVVIPYVKENRILQIINSNASEYFPVNIDEYLLAHTVKGAEEIDGVKKLRVMIYAAPESMVEDYYKLAYTLGKEVESIDYEGNSSAQLIAQQMGQAVSLVIHIEEKHSIISISKAGELRIQRIVPYGKELVVDALLADDDELDKEKALELLATERIIHNTFDGDMVTDSLRYLINNTNRVVDYYNSKYPDEPIEEAFVTGESVELLGIENLCANEFKFSVMQISILKGVHLDKAANISQNLECKYAVCIGAVVNPCNFKARIATERERKSKSGGTLRIMIGATVVLVIGLIVVPLPGLIDVQMRIREAEQGIEKYGYVQSDVDLYFACKDAYDDIKKLDDYVSNNNDTLAKYIADLEAVSPSDISIKSMSINDGEVGVSAICGSKESIAKYAMELKALSYVSEVFIQSMSEAVNEDGVVTVTFSLVYRIEAVEEETEEVE